MPLKSNLPKKSVLPLSPEMILTAQTGHVLPAPKSSTLISAEQLCDEDCDFFFRKRQVHVLKNLPDMDEFSVTQEIY